jgi:hypothetical protein
MTKAFASGEADLSNEFTRVFLIRVDRPFPVTTIPRHVLFTSPKKTLAIYIDWRLKTLPS